MDLRLVPGFSQPPSVWDTVIAALPGDLRDGAVALDVPDGLDFGATAHALGERGGAGCYVGYSMGGRLALRLALDRPDLVEGLVLVSASPGIGDAGDRAGRRAADDTLAAEIERDGVGPFLERWLAQPLFATLPPDRAMGEARAAAMSATRLAHQMRALGQGAMEPVWEDLAELEPPALLLVGTSDAKYSAIADEMFECIDDCMVRALPGGHALPLESPIDVADAIASFAHELTS